MRSGAQPCPTSKCVPALQIVAGLATQLVPFHVLPRGQSTCVTTFFPMHAIPSHCAPSGQLGWYPLASGICEGAVVAIEVS
jgi:hypothetical protein